MTGQLVITPADQQVVQAKLTALDISLCDIQNLTLIQEAKTLLMALAAEMLDLPKTINPIYTFIKTSMEISRIYLEMNNKVKALAAFLQANPDEKLVPKLADYVNKIRELNALKTQHEQLRKEQEAQKQVAQLHVPNLLEYSRKLSKISELYRQAAKLPNHTQPGIFQSWGTVFHALGLFKAYLNDSLYFDEKGVSRYDRSVAEMTDEGTENLYVDAYASISKADAACQRRMDMLKKAALASMQAKAMHGALPPPPPPQNGSSKNIPSPQLPRGQTVR